MERFDRIIPVDPMELAQAFSSELVAQPIFRIHKLERLINHSLDEFPGIMRSKSLGNQVTRLLFTI